MSSDKSDRALRAIWDKVSVKAEDGQRYILLKNRDDIEYLYCSGFVDETKFGIQKWVDSFADALMPNSAYLLDEHQWMDKVQFHYSGPVKAPFDPMQLREGEWTEDEMQELIREKILPSIYLTADDFGKIFEEAKKQGLMTDGRYIINRATKEGLLDLINDCPSPRRCRELSVAELQTTQAASPAASQVPPSRQATERLQQLLKGK